MPDISISVNATAAQGVLSRAPDRVSIAMRGAVEDGATYVLAKVKHYPPQRPGSSYIRTHTLEKSWSKRVTGNGLSVQGRIGSNSAMAPYNRLVQSRRDQAEIHRGRWSSVEDIAEESQPTVQRFFEDRLRAAGLER